MNKEIIINGKNYTLKEIDFTGICTLEELGFSIAEVKNRTFSTYRACFAFHANLDLVSAGKEIELHIKSICIL